MGRMVVGVALLLAALLVVAHPGCTPTNEAAAGGEAAGYWHGYAAVLAAEPHDPGMKAPDALPDASLPSPAPGSPGSQDPFSAAFTGPLTDMRALITKGNRIADWVIDLQARAERDGAVVVKVELPKGGGPSPVRGGEQVAQPQPPATVARPSPQPQSPIQVRSTTQTCVGGVCYPATRPGLFGRRR